MIGFLPNYFEQIYITIPVVHLGFEEKISYSQS